MRVMLKVGFGPSSVFRTSQEDGTAMASDDTALEALTGVLHCIHGWRFLVNGDIQHVDASCCAMPTGICNNVRRRGTASPAQQLTCRCGSIPAGLPAASLLTASYSRIRSASTLSAGPISRSNASRARYRTCHRQDVKQLSVAFENCTSAPSPLNEESEVRLVVMLRSANLPVSAPLSTHCCKDWGGNILLSYWEVSEKHVETYIQRVE
jgi:hypothetical protein